MRVLVTGASGLIGRGVATTLAERGDEVTVLQRRPSGLGLPEVLADLTDADSMRAATAGQDAIVHAAARVGVAGTWSDFQSVNVTGTANLLAGARRAGVGRFVHISSPSVAHSGSSLVGVSATPAEPDRANSHYSRSKAMAELLALQASSGEFAVVAIRPHLVWGPGDLHLVGRIVDRGRRGRLAVVGRGAALIDTTYVDNATSALVSALDRAPNLSGQALVVSNGEPRTVREMFELICTAAGVPGPRFAVPAQLARFGGAGVEAFWRRTGRSGEPPLTKFLAEQLATAHWFDQRRTRAALDWEPAVSLEEGLVRLARWFDSNS